MARRKRSSNRSHARHTTALATRPNVVVVRSGGGGRRRSRSGTRTVVVRGGGRGRRMARAAGGHALHATGLGVGGAVLGYLQGAGHLDFVPAVMGSKTLGMGLLGFIATRMTKNKYVRDAGVAAVAVAGFEFGREHGAGGGGGRPAAGHGRVQGAGWDGGGMGPFAGG